MIAGGQLAPGQKLVQEDLARAIGVSRTPLLKAFERLEREFLVAKLPRRGVVVRRLSPRELLDAFDCREGLEVVAARLAAERASRADAEGLRRFFARFMTGSIDLDRYMAADQGFHRRVFALADNPMLSGLDLVGNVHAATYQRGLIRPPSETLREHLEIIDAIAARDPAAAESAMRAHLRRSRDRLIAKVATLEKAGEPETPTAAAVPARETLS